MKPKKQAAATVQVRFIQHDAPYQVGEVKDCAAAEAAKLVGHDVAEYVEGTDAGDR